MPVSASSQLTDPACRARAANLAQRWTPLLQGLGRHGEYRIGHGSNRPCADVHGETYNGGLWIFTTDGPGAETKSCKTFLSDDGNELSFAGAAHAEPAKLNTQWHGACACGGNHP